ncbi:MAG: hypothetical protein RLZZ550_1828 [Verrucomicrobiota bacterium]
MHRGDALAGRQAPGPAHEGVHAHPALVGLVLPAAQGRVGRDGRASLGRAHVRIAPALDAAVVRGEDDQRILQLAGRLKRVDQLADLGVELGHERGVAAHGVVLRGVRAEADAVIGLEILLRGIDGDVHGAEGHIHEPRTPRGPDLALGLGGDELGGVALLLHQGVVPVPGILQVALAVLVRPRVDRAGQEAVGFVEAVAARTPLELAAKMPLAGDGRAVASRLHRRGQREGALREGPQVRRTEHMRAEAAGPTSGEEGRAGRRADGLDVMAIEFDGGLEQLRHPRGPEATAVPGNVGPPHVVGDDEEHVRLGRLRRRQPQEQAAGEQQVAGRHGHTLRPAGTISRGKRGRGADAQGFGNIARYWASLAFTLAFSGSTCGCSSASERASSSRVRVRSGISRTRPAWAFSAAAAA